MRNSRIVLIQIARPYEDAYAILREPTNFPRWSPVVKGTFERYGDSGFEYLVDLPRGRRVLRFTPPNPFGVLDYTVLVEGESTGWITPMRLVRNGEGSDLITVFYQRPETSDEAFASEMEWAVTDLNAVKSVVERF